jgi:leucine-zipper-like transcriptional regulator 1
LRFNGILFIAGVIMQIAMRILLSLPLLALILFNGCSNFSQDNPFDVTGSNWHPPQTAAMADTSVGINDIARLHASGTDANGTIATYQWDFGNGAVRTTTTSFLDTAFTVAGNKTILVSSIDNDGIQSTEDPLVVSVKEKAPTLGLPANLSNLTSRDVTLYWAGNLYQDHYSVLLDTVSSPRAAVMENYQTVSGFYNIFKNTDYSLKYYWRIAGCDGSGNCDTSATWSFSTPAFPSIPFVAEITERHGHSIIAFNDNLYVLGGAYSYDNSTLYLMTTFFSRDGLKWSAGTYGTGMNKRTGHSSVVYDNKMWMIGGWDGTNRLADVWQTSNGYNWIQATSSASFGQRNMHSSVTYNNRMWVIGGNSASSYLADVWYSTDGATWTRATANAAFGPRTMAGAAVFAGKMWIIGGYSGSGYLKDAWSSTDGVTWTQASTAAFGVNKGRGGISAFEYNGKLWTVGGYDSSSTYIGMYNSTDGATWTRYFPAVDYEGRFFNAAAVFDNRFWIIGGLGWNTSASVYESTNQIWAYKP